MADLQKIEEIFPEAAHCRHCSGCDRACPKHLDVQHGVNLAVEGDIIPASEVFDECVMCNLCTLACPENIRPNHLGVFVRRMVASLALRPMDLMLRLQQIERGELSIDLDAPGARPRLIAGGPLVPSGSLCRCDQPAIDRARRRPAWRRSPVEDLLRRYHPDHRGDAHAVLAVGANRGERCQPELARQLQSNALIDDVDIAGAPLVDTDVLVVGGGGAGCAAALVAAGQGAEVILATKLRLGDSNTVMAEGGIQAASARTTRRSCTSRTLCEPVTSAPTGNSSRRW